MEQAITAWAEDWKDRTMWHPNKDPGSASDPAGWWQHLSPEAVQAEQAASAAAAAGTSSIIRGAAPSAGIASQWANGRGSGQGGTSTPGAPQQQSDNDDDDLPPGFGKLSIIKVRDKGWGMLSRGAASVCLTSPI